MEATITAALQQMTAAITELATANAQRPAGEGGPSGGIPHFSKYVEGENFEDYCEQFEGLATVHRYTEAQQKASFLALLSPSTFQLLKNLLFPTELSQADYSTLKDKLKQHLKPTPLQIPSRHALHSRKQREGESVPDFMAALRALASPCKYNADVLNEVLKDTFVAGIRSKSILDRLFTEPDSANLDSLYKIAVTVERAEASTHTILDTSSSTINKVNHHNQGKKPYDSHNSKQQSNHKHNNSKQKDDGSKKLICYACSKPNHTHADCRIKDRLKCNFCDGAGHVEKVCIKKKKSVNVHELSTHQGQPWLLPVKVAGKMVEFELDTGSPVTILPITLYNSIRNAPKLESTEDVFTPYGGSPSITPVGTATLPVSFKSIHADLPIYVVRSGSMPLMGRQWLEKLKIFTKPMNVHHIQGVTQPKLLTALQEKYPDVFQDGIGKAPGVVSIQLKDNAVPVFRKARSVPYALRSKVEAELDKWIDEGILIPVEHSQWATPIVPAIQKGNNVRICGDYACTVNPLLKIPTYPLPCPEELLAEAAQGKVFAKLDIRKAYLCLELDAESSQVLTINTQKGLLRPTRLMFGVASAPVSWTKFIESITRNLEGLCVYFDDLLVYGSNEANLHARLQKVLETLSKNGLRLNTDKCDFFTTKVTYLGHELSPSGIRPMGDRVEAIRKVPTPISTTEVKSFLGMVSYYSKFFPKMATIASPLYNLTRNDVKFKWTTECEHAFTTLKDLLTSDQVLAPYNPSLPLVLSADASPYALGAVLSHVFPDGTERPITFIHKRLSKTQEAYSQIDKEALAIRWSVEKLHTYLFGREFTLFSDHQPLLYIFDGSQRKKLPALCATRLLRYMLFLQDYNFKIKYRKSSEHGNADFLSRLPQHSTKLNELCGKADDELDPHDELFINNITLLPMSSKELARATEHDQEGRQLLQQLRDGTSLGTEKDLLFSLQGGCVMRGLRTFIPSKYRKAILEELHDGHLGICKMKALARNHVYWANIDSQIEELCRNCKECALHKGRPPTVKTHYWEYPSKVWERLHADFAFYGKNTYLLIVDAYSKWPEVYIVPNMNASTVIGKFNSLFASYGLPMALVTDNQSTFVSSEMRSYLRQRNIKHMTISPYHAASNGLAERMVGNLKQCLRTLQYAQGQPQDNLNAFLAAYRRAPHSTTGESPSLLFLKRELHTPLNFARPGLPPRIQQRKEEEFVDPILHEGERVAVRDFQNPLKKWKIGTVLARDGQLQYTVIVDGELHRKHIEHLRRVGENVSPSVVAKTVTTAVPHVVVPKTDGETTPAAQASNEEPSPVISAPEECDSAVSTPAAAAAQAVVPEPAPLIQRPRRERRLPARYRD